jgi:hypothetical protein
MTRASWLRTVMAVADLHGGSVTTTRGNHLRIELPQGGTVYTSSTPSDWRSLKNMQATLRRMSRTKVRRMA